MVSTDSRAAASSSSRSKPHGAATSRAAPRPLRHSRNSSGSADGSGEITWIRFEADLLCGAVTGTISASLAPFTARVLLGEAIPAAAGSLSPASLVSRLGNVPVEVHAVLGRAAFTLDELSSLRVGDVIALDRSAQDPVDIVIHDRAFFRARAGVAGQWVAIELIGAPKEEKRYEY